jgi:hypothetical protein
VPWTLWNGGMGTPCQLGKLPGGRTCRAHVRCLREARVSTSRKLCSEMGRDEPLLLPFGGLLAPTKPCPLPMGPRGTCTGPWPLLTGIAPEGPAALNSPELLAFRARPLGRGWPAKGGGRFIWALMLLVLWWRKKSVSCAAVVVVGGGG